LIENQFWNSAINRMYYACFYAVGALLVLNGVETSSHSGMRQKFGQLFVKTGEINRDLGKHYSELFEKRHKGQVLLFLLLPALKNHYRTLLCANLVEQKIKHLSITNHIKRK
jgi:uncharacterized protein (UPF0332 family)